MQRTVKPILRIATAVIAACIACGAPASARDVPVIEIGTDLAFGAATAANGPGSIVVTPQGTQSCLGAIDCLGGQRPGLFYVTGRKDEMVVILLSDLVLSSNGERMTARLVPSDSILVLRPGNRKNSFTVGGTLEIGARQPAGSYSGTYDVTIEYQ